MYDPTLHPMVEAWLRQIAPQAPKRIGRVLMNRILAPIAPGTPRERIQEEFLTAATVLDPRHRPEWLTAALAAWPTQVVVVLNDGETWSNISGCKFVRLSPAEADDPDVDETVKRRYRELTAEPVVALGRTFVVTHEKGPAP